MRADLEIGNRRALKKYFAKVGFGRVAIAALVLGISLPVQSQEQSADAQALDVQAELQMLRDQLQAALRRIDQLEAGQTKTAAVVETVAKPTVKSKLPISISGLFQTQYNAFLSDDRATTPRSTADGFRIRRAEIKLQAQINERLSATIMFDPTANTNGRDLQDLKLSYLMSKSQSGSNTLDIGQFKIPVGYEGDLVSSSALQTVERALIYRNGDPIGGRGFDQREQGAMLSGNRGAIRYWLGAFDGLGEDQNRSSSLSDNLALVGRVAYTPRESGITLGISGAVSNPRNAMPAGAPAGALTRVDRDLLGLFAVYNNDRITAQAEYATGSSDVVAAPGIAAASVDRRGYYGSLGYRFAKKLEGVLRYDVFDPDTNTANNDMTETTLGLNYYIKDNNAKIQLNLVKANDDRPNRDSTQVRSNFQLAF